MKAQFINPFVTAAVSTLEQFIPDSEINRGELNVAEAPVQTRGAAVYIGISGELQGRVIYDMDRSTAIKIANAMNHENLSELNDLVCSTIQELGNIISGNATSKLHEELNGKKVNITPPSMIVGGDTQISDSVDSKYLKVPLNCNCGEILINLNICDT